MKDAFGNDLEIGDIVAFNPPYYKGLSIGTVIAFTPKMVKVSYKGNYKDVDTTVVFPQDTVKRTK